MGRNLTARAVFIIVLVVLAAWTLFPPTKTLKPGIDLAGGTSLIFEIDTTGLSTDEQRDLAERMITVLRRRIDPANIQNLIWRPLGNTRFEIQMPLASAEARHHRELYEQAKRALLSENINRALIFLSLKKSAQERSEDFKELAEGSEWRLEILTELGAVHDEREELRQKRDRLSDELKTPENLISVAGLNLEDIKSNLGQLIGLDETKLEVELKEYTKSEANLDLLKRYVNMYGQWAAVVDDLADPNEGANARYDDAVRSLDKLNLSEDQVDYALELRAGSGQRDEAIAKLKEQFSDLSAKVDGAVKSYDAYRPYQGRLDDSKDLQRMLKGAGILEFRILPMPTDSQFDAERMKRYVETLKGKGPNYASDEKYVWCEIENIEEWGLRNSIVARFGDKYYVLASNQSDERILHQVETRSWKLEDARATQDRMGRRAIGFRLDERGGALFRNVTGKNLNRPLCILLDGIAISAPTIQARIGRDGIITGTFSETEVGDMVNKLNAGSLPARLVEQPIMVKTIGPSIGAGNRDQGIKAGLIGLVVVLVCMAAYYTLAGSVADVALLLNILFVLSMMSLLRATFTLPGIAGIILTIGMSVDANVLIFERIREEQERGASLRVAIRNGYQRAFRAIFDANLTTFITAAILFWRASEEVKGFAIVLMLGIVSSMFTALFVTRVIFDALTSRRIIREHLVMLRLIHTPNVNWMRARPVFLTVSGLLIAGGLLVFFMRDDTANNKYDIEFTGGTSLQIDLKEGVELARQQVQDKIYEVGAKRNNPALQAANVYSIGKAISEAATGEKLYRQYEITTTETNKTLATVKLAPGWQETLEGIASAIKDAQRKSRGRLGNLVVTKLGDNPGLFQIATSQVNASVVRDILGRAFAEAEISEPQLEQVVNDAILEAFKGQLEIQENLEPEIASEDKITEDVIDANGELADFLGGVKITCRIARPVTVEQLRARFSSLRFKPGVRDLAWGYEYELFGPQLNKPDAQELLDSFIFVSVAPEAGLRELEADEWDQFVANERRKVLSAAELETSLARVTQIDPSIGAEAKTRALIAIVLSLFAIVGYVWVRFGSVRYGFAAIAALVHDVCITLGVVVSCTYIATTVIGSSLLIGDFKIDLAMIAAFLTLIGYSLNDTIVVFDRIRENRRKGKLDAGIINNSINQTMSRTLLTSFTTFVVVLVMYIFGGPGMRSFTFAIGLGVVVGTYSSIAIAAPLLLLGRRGTRKSGK